MGKIQDIKDSVIDELDEYTNMIIQRRDNSKNKIKMVIEELNRLSEEVTKLVNSNLTKEDLSKALDETTKKYFNMRNKHIELKNKINTYNRLLDETKEKDQPGEYSEQEKTEEAEEIDIIKESLVNKTPLAPTNIDLESKDYKEKKEVENKSNVKTKTHKKGKKYYKEKAKNKKNKASTKSKVGYKNRKKTN